MELLELARGPLLAAAIVIFVSGIAWRCFGVLRLKASVSMAAPRRTGAAAGGLATVLRRMLPRADMRASSTLVTFNPYFFHIGLALVFFGYAPHIAFIRRLTGLHWPALPDAVMYIAAGATIISLLIALMMRLTDRVLRLISRFDDYFTWFVTMLPLVTGMALIAEPSAAVAARDAVLYPVPLAMHLLSLELLLAWFPFGKLMHAILFAPGRAQFGAFMASRGVDA
jgi:nitrate reductase gamma subunit